MTGDQGLGFTGNYGNMDGQRSVEGTLPAEYAQPVNTGMMEFDTVSAVFQSQGSGRLKVALVCNGEVVREQETTAEFGVV